MQCIHVDKRDVSDIVVLYFEVFYLYPGISINLNGITCQIAYYLRTASVLRYIGLEFEAFEYAVAEVYFHGVSVVEGCHCQ